MELKLKWKTFSRDGVTIEAAKFDSWLRVVHREIMKPGITVQLVIGNYVFAAVEVPNMRTQKARAEWLKENAVKV